MRSGIVLLFAGVILAQSQPPSPTPTKTGQENESKAPREKDVADANQSNANTISSAIDKLTAEVASWKKQESAAPSKENASSEWWLKGSTIASEIATVAIAFLAFFQWRTMQAHKKALDAMAQHMQKGLVETTIAADAAKSASETASRQAGIMEQQAAIAKQSAEAATEAANAAKLTASLLRDSERAWLIFEKNMLSPDGIFKAPLCFKNYGRTPAWLTELRADLQSSPSDEIGILKNYEVLPIIAATPYGEVIAPEKSTEVFYRQANGRSLTESEAEQVKKRALFVHCFGVARYHDIARDHHETRFCFTYKSAPTGGGEWERSGPPENNKST